MRDKIKKWLKEALLLEDDNSNKNQIKMNHERNKHDSFQSNPYSSNNITSVRMYNPRTEIFHETIGPSGPNRMNKSLPGRNLVIEPLDSNWYLKENSVEMINWRDFIFTGKRNLTYVNLDVINNCYGYIYLIVNNLNGDIYIGKHVIRRKEQWLTYMGSGSKIIKQIENEGKENFSKYLLTTSTNKIDLAYEENLFLSATSHSNVKTLNISHSELSHLKDGQIIKEFCYGCLKTMNWLLKSTPYPDFCYECRNERRSNLIVPRKIIQNDELNCILKTEKYYEQVSFYYFNTAFNKELEKRNINNYFSLITHEDFKDKALHVTKMVRDLYSNGCFIGEPKRTLYDEYNNSHHYDYEIRFFSYK